MKKFKYALIIPALLIVASCKKDNSKTSANATVSTDVAADMAASAVSSNSYGFASMAANIGANAQIVAGINGGAQTVNSVSTNATMHQECGATVADSLSFSGSADSTSVSVFYKFSRTLNCNAGAPDNLVNAVTFTDSFSGPRLSSSDSGTSNVTISGLAGSASNFTINGSYDRKGTFTSKVGNKANGSSEVDITVTNVTITKSPLQISGGSANITISGSVAAGSFSFTGTLVFNGGNQATLTIGTSVYVINLLTGSYVKK